jgi:Cu+-exporting ATPase
MTTSATVHDPVCHMDIDPARAAGTATYEDVTYYFCSTGCRLDFEDDPAAALAAEAAHDHSQPSEHGMITMQPKEEDASSKPRWQFWKK